MKATCGLPWRCRLKEGLDRTLSDLKHIALGIVSVTGSEAASLPLFTFRADFPAKFRRRCSCLVDARDRQTQLDWSFLANLGRVGDMNLGRDLLRNAVNDDLKAFVIENDVIFVLM